MKPIQNLSKFFVLSLVICFSAANAQLPTKNVVGKVLLMQRTEKGANAFNSQFAVNATGRNNMNAFTVLMAVMFGVYLMNFISFNFLIND